ncbi:hypothetical protein LD112_24755 [Pantoea agglomerans]|nr:hypothetical protein [Pantoea agglomerans]
MCEDLCLFLGYITGFLGLSKLTEKSRKNAAEWGFLLSTLFIVPLFFLHDASELVKIGMQLLWGGLRFARSLSGQRRLEEKKQRSIDT